MCWSTSSDQYEKYIRVITGNHDDTFFNLLFNVSFFWLQSIGNMTPSSESCYNSYH